MLRVAICEDVLSELQKQTQIIQSIMARLSKNVKFFCFRSGEELLMETDTTGNMDIVFLDVEMLGISGIETARILRERDSRDRKSTRLNSSHNVASRMPSSA